MASGSKLACGFATGERFAKPQADGKLTCAGGRRRLADDRADRISLERDLLRPQLPRAEPHADLVGAWIEREAQLRRLLAAAAVAAGDLPHSAQLAVLGMHLNPAADQAIA